MADVYGRELQTGEVISFSLTTPRLRLRLMSIDHLDFVAEMLGDKDVMNFYPALYSRMEAAEWIERQVRRYRENGHGLWLVENAHDGVPVGQVGLSMQDVDGVLIPELGYLIHREFWRQGYAYEAASAVLEYAWNVQNYPKVVSLIRPENLPSRAVAKKLGMTESGNTLHHEILHLVYSIANPS